MAGSELALLPVGILLIIALAFALIGLKILRFTVRMVWRSVAGPLSVVGPIATLAALVLALIYDMRPFVSVLWMIIDLINLTLLQLPSGILVRAPELLDACSGGISRFSFCVARVATVFQASFGPLWANFANDLPRQVEEVAKAIVIFGSSLLLILVVRQVISIVLRTQPPSADVLRKLGGAAAIAIFLGGALYLAIAAIIAIPVFNDRATNLEEARRVLERDLATITTAYEPRIRESAGPGSQQISTDIASLELMYADVVAININSSDINSTARGYNVEIITSIRLIMPYVMNVRHRIFRGDIDALRNAMDGRSEAYAALLDSGKRLPEHAATLVRRMQAAFDEQNPGRVGGQLTLDHVARLKAQLELSLAASLSLAEQCRAGLTLERGLFRQAEAELRRFADSSRGLADAARSGDFERLVPALMAEGSLTPVAPGSGRFTSLLIGGQGFELRGPGSVLPSFNQSAICQSIARPLAQAEVVARPDPGAGLGVFGKAAGWLLSTQSRDLALITGLLGFGFFGAISTTFIRQIAASGGGPIAASAWIVPALIRGVAAAMLVFLAVLGGISVFAESNPPVNAYAVFLACFIAAVFSEDVWEWARRRQQEQFDRRQDSGGQAQPTAPPASSP